MIYYLAPEYDRSLEKMNAANPKGGPTFIRASVLAAEGRYEEATTDYQQLGSNVAARGHLAHTYALAGKTVPKPPLRKVPDQHA
jgi:hypothetical protein